jgi:hypothetical protein
MTTPGYTTVDAEFDEKFDIDGDILGPVKDDDGEWRYQDILSVDDIKQFIHEKISQAVQNRESEIKDLIHKRKVEYYKKCLEDQFINGRFWEAQELWELLSTPKEDK